MADKTNIVIINGPNLNLLGRRDALHYGSQSLAELIKAVGAAHPDIPLVWYQSNSEGEIIDLLHRCGFDTTVKGIVLNAGAYTHYSYAIADAIEAIEAPVVEVHLSNIHAREVFRRLSVIAPQCRGSISGFGADSYILAIEAIKRFDK